MNVHSAAEILAVAFSSLKALFLGQLTVKGSYRHVNYDDSEERLMGLLFLNDLTRTLWELWKCKGWANTPGGRAQCKYRLKGRKSHSTSGTEGSSFSHIYFGLFCF